MREPHRAYVVALFVDLVGFVNFAETADPEVLFGRLHEFHAAVGEVVDAHGGNVIDYIGDGVFIIFNDPVEIAEPEYHALLAAVQVRDRLRALTQRWTNEGDKLGSKLSLDAGYATLGEVGYPGHYKYGVVGRTVNSAGLMHRACGDGVILASERLVSETSDRFTTRSPTQEVRDKLQVYFGRRSAKPLKVVEIVGVRTT